MVNFVTLTKDEQARVSVWFLVWGCPLIYVYSPYMILCVPTVIILEIVMVPVKKPELASASSLKYFLLMLALFSVLSCDLYSTFYFIFLK